MLISTDKTENTLCMPLNLFEKGLTFNRQADNEGVQKDFFHQRMEF